MARDVYNSTLITTNSTTALPISWDDKGEVVLVCDAGSTLGGGTLKYTGLPITGATAMDLATGIVSGTITTINTPMQEYRAVVAGATTPSIRIYSRLNYKA